MEISADQMSQQNPPRRKKGGLVTIPFILANESFERVASYGLLPNMILYLMKDYHMTASNGTIVIFMWSAATNFLPLVGAFLADSYLGRFLTIGLASICSLLGMILLWLTTMIPQTKPPPCDNFGSCISPTPSQFTLLFFAFVFMSIGAGGIRPCSLAFGAVQLDRRDNPKNERVLESYFGWYYASAAFSVLIAVTAIVYIQDHKGWRIGFGVPAILMVCSAFFFVIASPLYFKPKATTSLFSGFAQVIVVAYRNRKLAFPPRNSDGWYHHKKDSKLVMPSDTLRFLNKACIIRSPEQDITPDGLTSNPWSLCTVDQVEELKALIKVIPMWSTGIMIAILLSQQTFPLLQAQSLDRHFISNFEIPAGSFGSFTIIALIFWVLLYDRVILPLASKFKGKPVQINVKLRMGIGLFLSCIAMVVAGIVENIRRRKAIQQGFLNNPNGVLKMSAMWLVPQHILMGFAEAFNAIGQTEFYYSEFPKSMSSIASALFALGMGVASLLAAVIVSTVGDVTSRGGKGTWVASEVNKGHYDNYYWLLAILSLVNLLYFIACSWAYGPCVVKGTKVGDEGEDLKEEGELPKLEAKDWDEGEDLKKEEELPKQRAKDLDEGEGLKVETELSKSGELPA